jgi:hypothetical protein
MSLATSAGASFVDWFWDRSAIGVVRWRRTLQIVLGLIWLLDAGLQFQPYMFGKDFVTEVLQGSASGDPSLVKSPMLSVAHMVLRHPAVWNSGFALVQLSLAIAILYRPTVRVGLGASVVWSLAVWWFGEGMGGLFSGLAPVLGLPGAALLYAVIALLLWPSRRATGSVATAGPLGDLCPKLLWFLIWGSYSWFMLFSANRSPEGLARAVSAGASGEPQWEKSVDATLARALAHHGTQVSIALAVLSAFVAIAIFLPRCLRAGLIVGGVIGAAYWVAQDFGGIFTSQGTDPNTGPLLILLAMSFWVLSRGVQRFTTDFSDR